MDRKTLAVAAASALAGGLLVTTLTTPAADAAPFDKRQRRIASSISLNGFCGAMLADGGWRITTQGTINVQTELPDGSSAITTEALERGEPCDVGSLTRDTLKLCARTARGMER